MSANIVDKLRGTVVFDTLKKKGAFFGALPILRPSGAAQAALTDSTGGTAGTTLAAGVGVTPVTIPLTSLATGLSTSAIDLLTGYTPGFRFRIVSLEFVTTVAGTGAGASQTFNLEIGTTNVTGGVLSLTLASQAAIGTITAATAITANNIGSSTDAISLEMAAGGTVFTAGAGYFIMELQNLDTADAIASGASLLGAIRSALVSLGLIKGAA
jgi:hypothetical protein